MLNIAAMAGKNEESELLAWLESQSVRRPYGSYYAFHVAGALVDTELLRSDSGNENDPRTSLDPTYKALVEAVHDILVAEVDSRDSQTPASCSAQEGASEIPQINSVRLPEDITSNDSEAQHRLRRLAQIYMDSYPGSPDAANNRPVHLDCRRLIRGETKDLSHQDLELLAKALRYRLKSIVSRATEYKNYLGLDFPDCAEHDSANIWRKPDPNLAMEYRREQLFNRIAGAHIFDDPVGGEGYDYDKGVNYLALALAQTSWDIPTISQKLDELACLHQSQSKPHITARALALHRRENIRSMLADLAESSQRHLRDLLPLEASRKRLRDFSPVNSSKRHLCGLSPETSK